MIEESNAVLEISKKNIINNYFFFKKIINKNICGVTIKANAYGLGANIIYKLLYQNGCRHFFVATTKEGLELREKFKKGSIYILNGLELNNYKIFEKLNLIPILSNLNDYLLIKNKSLKFGVQINTGINRLGINYEDYKKINFNDQNLVILLSHLASADERINIFNKIQLSKFNNLKKKSQNNKIIFSLSNSFGSVLSNKYLFEMIRPGISIYGGHFNNSKLKKNIKPIVKLKAKILQIKKIEKNEYIGYNQTFKTKKKTWIAIIGIGYADGLKRMLSNKGKVFYNNKKFNIIGRVSMDSIVIDITKSKSDFKLGCYVEIINKKYGIDYLAKSCGTISHEILTSLTKRVERKFV